MLNLDSLHGRGVVNRSMHIMVTPELRQWSMYSGEGIILEPIKEKSDIGLFDSQNVGDQKRLSTVSNCESRINVIFAMCVCFFCILANIL